MEITKSDINEHLAQALSMINSLYIDSIANDNTKERECLRRAKDQTISAINNINKTF